MARVEDNWINVRLRESDSIWDRDGWAERCGVGVEVPDNGYGQTAENEIRIWRSITHPRSIQSPTPGAHGVLQIEYLRVMRK